MQIVSEPAEYQRIALAWRREGIRHAQVPTMGALHEGHLRLIDEAKRRADRVSLTLFVNSIQFNAAEDLAKYPRTWDADVAACRARGVDVLFAPEKEAMYPSGFQTHVEVERLAGPLCGAHRPGHFRGVATVVMKLFQLGQPTAAVFGWKDAQQFLILRRMARDLDLPIEMIGMETVRESDGLAMSSRNRRLTPEQRVAAPAIFKGLAAAANLFDAGEKDMGKLIDAARAEIEREAILKIEYLEGRSMETMEALDAAREGETLIAAAVWAGDVRLIDNVRV